MFLGREKEIENLNSELLSQKKSVCLVYGKRRIGKSSLINEVAKTFDGVVINHLCIKSSYEGNLSLLCRSVALALNLPVSTNFATIFDLFDFLNSQNKKILVILDEYQYFKESK
ncbi:MAG: ATP-binding protein, partial [Spirochaetaceae bacterium]|nr:ATP-binding protein [Spirochaetaceae bacterium]